MDHDDGDGCWRSLLIDRFSITFFKDSDTRLLKKGIILRKEINTKFNTDSNSENSLQNSNKHPALR